MTTRPRPAGAQLTELRLFVEEICYNLCRFQHVVQEGLASADVRIHQEVYLGSPGAFADIRVMVRGAAPYFVEVKYGYPRETIIRHIRRKYGAPTEVTRCGSKVVLVVDTHRHPDWREGEIVASNAFFQRLPEESQAAFAEMEALEARNIGRVKAWRLRPVDPALAVSKEPSG